VHTCGRVVPVSAHQGCVPVGAQIDGNAEPVTGSALAQALTQATATENIAANSSAQTTESVIEQVYNPERSDNTNNPQSTMDDIKKRYEDILVLYMFMQKCTFAQATDYSVITSAMAQELAAVNAPSRLHNDILSSARGAFDEIYAESACDGETIAPLRQQYQDYVHTLQNNFLLTPKF
jgi:hypothetical protein